MLVNICTEWIWMGRKIKVKVKAVRTYNASQLNLFVISAEICNCSREYKYFHEILMFVSRKCNSFAWREDEMSLQFFDSPHLSLGLIFLPFCVHS